MWPKSITIKGIAVQVEDIEELDAFISRYGSDVSHVSDDIKPNKKTPSGALSMNDRSLLQQFVDRDNKGVLNKDLGKFLGASGKAIGPALRKWGLRIGLSHHDKQQAFERFNRPDGRGYKLSAPFTAIAKQLL